MTGEREHPLGIRLYVPQALLDRMRVPITGRCAPGDYAGLEFIEPGWWEGCHTVWHGPLICADPVTP